MEAAKKYASMAKKLNRLEILDDVDKVFEYAAEARKVLEPPSVCLYYWDLCVLFACARRANARYQEDEHPYTSSPFLRNAVYRDIYAHNYL
jgi:hypothetical protein